MPLFDPALFRILPGSIDAGAGGGTPVLRSLAPALERHIAGTSCGRAGMR